MSKFAITKKQIKFLDNNRIYILLVLVMVFMCLFAPKFLSPRNFATILRSASMNALAAIGFSIILISGQLDLSLGSAISLGAVFTVGFRLQFSALDPTLAWSLGFLIAIAAGAVVGLINGLLVAKVKITSFIVTLGMLEMARARNPRGRLTTPEDVAAALVALADEGSGWISGNVINVDGGEEIVA